ncbi:apoptosis-associated speck-like protein containing a CARD [Hyla sarda]|uniref:apoptosis-associated speck-like protein containing a CARD n=1 Tax=Hyla sarda TaxID=327740 RepID=UPI0024C43FC4|nr:apoptosis-associated speck-like protein containing a CARD [Hyla sarda]
MADVEHFVDRHRAALIQRVVLVAQLLDDLLQWRLLTHEQYDRVRSMATSQDQMRELFSFARFWGNDDKDQILRSLREHNAPLIRSLEGK